MSLVSVRVEVEAVLVLRMGLGEDAEARPGLVHGEPGAEAARGGGGGAEHGGGGGGAGGSGGRSLGVGMGLRCGIVGRRRGESSNPLCPSLCTQGPHATRPMQTASSMSDWKGTLSTKGGLSLGFLGGRGAVADVGEVEGEGDAPLPVPRLPRLIDDQQGTGHRVFLDPHHHLQIPGF